MLTIGTIILSMFSGVLLCAAYMLRLKSQNDERQNAKIEQLQVELDKAHEQVAAVIDENDAIINQLRSEIEQIQVIQQDAEKTYHAQINTLTLRFAHDLGKSVGSIKANLNKLKKFSFEDESRQINHDSILSIVLANVEWAADDIHGIKSLLENDGQLRRAELERCDINEILTQLHEEKDELANVHNVTLKLGANKNLPDVFIDKEYIIRILTNLIHNAIQYSDPNKPEREVLLDLELQSDSQEVANLDRAVLVRVIDNGLGMEQELADSLLDGAALSKEQDRLVISGSGIGLANVKMYIDAHKKARDGYNIWVQSILGKGTSFTIQLPIA